MRYIIKNKLDYILRYVIGIFLLIVSLIFVLNPANAESFKILNQPDYIRKVLGYTEAFFCLLFIFNKSRYVGAYGLLLVFAFAAYLHLKAGIKPYTLIGWGAGVVFVLYCDYKRKQAINLSTLKPAN